MSPENFVLKVFHNINAQQGWWCTKWIKFIFMLIVWNGSAAQGVNQNEDTFLQKFDKIVMELLEQDIQYTRSMLDAEMLRLIESRIITDLLEYDLRGGTNEMTESTPHRATLLLSPGNPTTSQQKKGEISPLKRSMSLVGGSVDEKH
jgi:hypothetical protein